MTACLLVAGYSLLLALRQSPVGAGGAAHLSKIPDLPEPNRLPHRPSYVPASHDGERSDFPPTLRELGVTITELPAALPAGAGIAAFDAFDLPCAWAPLGTPTAGAATVTLAVPQTARLRLCVAADERNAARAYWCCTEVRTDGPELPSVTLPVPLQDVVVRAGARAHALGQALRLRRTDDPRWAPLQAFTTRGAIDDRGDVHLRLGPGTYELAPWTSPWPPVRISVPGPTEVAVTTWQ